MPFIGHPSGAYTVFYPPLVHAVALLAELPLPNPQRDYAQGSERCGARWSWFRGMPLNEVISKHGRLALPRFVPRFERLCEVLNAAHEQNIVHRDIKPANVMVLQRAGCSHDAIGSTHGVEIETARPGIARA